MPNQGTESQFEAKTIERLEALDYRYEYGGGIARELHEVVITDWVRSFLSFRYPHLNAEAIELVHLVDWQNVENNDLCVVNQLSIRGQNDRRPDVLIYLNGFPVVLFELKNPYEEEPNTLGAFNQVQHYKTGISQIFDFNALVIVSDGGMIVPVGDDAPKEAGSTLYGPWTASWEWFAPWKSINGRDVVENVTGAMKTLIEGLFPKDRLLDYIRHFIGFEVVNDKIEKKGAKYHQLFGIRFAVDEALRATRPEGDRRIGVIWHTQGSGKSLSMAYFVAILRHHPLMENPTFVIQVDRTDLDEQLYDQFVAVRSLVGNVQQAESVDQLRDLLPGEGGEVIFSTIEKFRLKDDEAAHPVLSERRNLIVIADEAHRTQYGLEEGFCPATTSCAAEGLLHRLHRHADQFRWSRHGERLRPGDPHLRHAAIPPRWLNGPDLLRPAAHPTGADQRQGGRRAGGDRRGAGRHRSPSRTCSLGRDGGGRRHERAH